MEWQFIVALVIAIPIILFPAAFVWYLNVGGIYAAIKRARARRAEREAKAKGVGKPIVTGEAALDEELARTEK